MREDAAAARGVGAGTLPFAGIDVDLAVFGRLVSLALEVAIETFDRLIEKLAGFFVVELLVGFGKG